MTKLLTWRDEWSLRIEPLDADHRALIGKLGDICLRFCPQARGGLRGALWRFPATARGSSEELIDALSDLGNEAAAHFRREETFMRAIGYDGLAEHAAEHARLLAEYREMLAGWRAHGMPIFDECTQEAVREWLLDHIAGGDHGFADAYHRLCGVQMPPREPVPFVRRRVPSVPAVPAPARVAGRWNEHGI